MRHVAGMLLLLSIISAAQASACSCGFSTPFAASAPLVIRGRVAEYLFATVRGAAPVAMVVDVTSVLRGSYGARRITVMGDWGMSCVPYVSNFPVGTEWLLAVVGPGKVPRFGDEVYSFPPCAQSGVPIVEGRVLYGDRVLSDMEVCKLLDRSLPDKAGLDAFNVFPRDGGEVISGMPQSTKARHQGKCGAGANLTYDFLVGSDGRILATRRVDGPAEAGWCDMVAYAAIRAVTLRAATLRGSPITAVHRLSIAVE